MKIKYNSTKNSSSGQERLFDLVFRIFGYPNALRLAQWKSIGRMLDFSDDIIVLDMGCGAGHYSYLIGKTTLCIAADILDTKPISIRLSQSEERCPYVMANALSMPFKSDSIDRILMSSLLQMVSDDRKILDEAYRVLKDDGILVISVPLDYIFSSFSIEEKNHLIEEFHCHGKGFYSREEIHELISSSGFQIIESEFNPKKVLSFAYEIWLKICLQTSQKPFSLLTFPVLFPFALLDRICNLECEGNEIIISARKFKIRSGQSVP